MSILFAILATAKATGLPALDNTHSFGLLLKSGKSGSLGCLRLIAPHLAIITLSRKSSFGSTSESSRSFPGKPHRTRQTCRINPHIAFSSLSFFKATQTDRWLTALGLPHSEQARADRARLQRGFYAHATLLHAAGIAREFRGAAAQKGHTAGSRLSTRMAHQRSRVTSIRRFIGRSPNRDLDGAPSIHAARSWTFAVPAGAAIGNAKVHADRCPWSPARRFD